MNYRFFTALAAGAVMLAYPSDPPRAADAASDADLRGVQSLRIAVSPMPVEAMDCNLDGNALARNLERRLNTKGIRTASGDDTVATLTVLSTHEPDRCSSAVMLGAYRKASFFDHDAGWLRTGYVVLWQSGLIVTSSPALHADQVGTTLDSLSDGLVEDWQKANAVAKAP